MSIDTRTPISTFNGATNTQGGSRPLPTRSRRPGLIAAAVLLIVGFALAGALLVSNAGGTTQVLVAARPVPAGQVITAADLTAVPVSGSVRAISAADLDSLVGQTAAVALVQGQLLNRAMLSGVAVPAPGESMVGLALRPGQLPADGLGVGDRVQAIVVSAVGDAGASPETTVRVLATGEVFALRPDPASASDTLVTLVVPAEAAGRIATHGAAGQVGLIKIASEVSR